MTSTLLSLTLTILLGADAPARAEKPRQPHPFAPSLPQLSDEEEERLDRIIDRFILHDTGKLPGEEGKKALADFQRLGPEAIFALIRGMNRAAAIESSCPAVIIAKKVSSFLRSTSDVELLDFARENIGLGVTHSRHLGVLKDLRAACLFRKAELGRQQAAQKNAPPKTPRTMTLAELAHAAGQLPGSLLPPILTELEKRNGPQVIDALAQAAGSTETETRQMARDLLHSHLARQTPVFLRQKLKDENAAVREVSAQVVGGKRLRFGGELIDLLGDADAGVRQSAHDALVRLGRGQDFGPEPGAEAEAREIAARQWRDWWLKQGGR